MSHSEDHRLSSHTHLAFLVIDRTLARNSLLVHALLVSSRNPNVM